MEGHWWVVMVCCPFIFMNPVHVICIHLDHYYDPALFDNAIPINDSVLFLLLWIHTSLYYPPRYETVLWKSERGGMAAETWLNICLVRPFKFIVSCPYITLWQTAYSTVTSKKVWLFPITGEYNEEHFKYTPRSDFHLDVWSLPYILLEVTSDESQKTDLYRMLIQASCIAWISNGRRKQGADHL